MPPEPLYLNHPIDRATGGIVSRGVLPQSPGFLFKPKRTLTTYGFVYVHAGSGFYKDTWGNWGGVGPGGLIVLFPGLAHAYGTLEGPGWSEIWLLVDSPLLAALEASGKLSRDCPLHELGPVDYWHGRFEAFIRDAPPEQETSGMREMGELIALLGEALDAGPSLDRREDARWLRRAQAGLALPQAALEDVARDVGTSYENFRKKFKRLAGQSPKQYQDRQRFDRACHLLRTTTLTLEHIAAELGACDAFHFSKQFKRRAGLSPRDFRRLYAGH